jgi:hypothetical protein
MECVFDETGREVKTLIGEHRAMGTYTDGFYADEAPPAGMYWYVLRVDRATVTKQMILVT